MPASSSGPQEDPFVAASAVVTGDVTLGRGVGIWHLAVLRGDTAPIVVDDESNIQDGAVLHVAPTRPCLVGKRVTVGHRAVLHGCTVEDGAMVGIGALVLNGAVVGAGAVVAAGAVVTEGTVVPPGMMMVGVPGRVAGPVDAALAGRIRRTTEGYIDRARAARREQDRSSTG